MPDERPVLLFGSATIDILGRALEPLSGGTSNEGWVAMTLGGVARNVAETLTRLGQDTILISAVGDDDYGLLLATASAEVGIDTSQMVQVPGGHSGSYLAMLDEDGRLRHALSDLTVMTAITPDYVQARSELFDEASMVVLDMNLPPATIALVINLARQAGIPVCADPTSQQLAARLKPHLAHLHFVSGNMAEVQALCDLPEPPATREAAISAAHCLVGRGVGVAAVTMAEFGVGYASPNSSGYVPAMHARVVKQTGAGDAFFGTAIFGMLNDIPLDEAFQLAAVAAGLTLQSEYTVLPDLSLDLLYGRLQ